MNKEYLIKNHSMKYGKITFITSLYNCDMYINNYLKCIEELDNIQYHKIFIWNVIDSNKPCTNKKIEDFCKNKEYITLIQKIKKDDYGLYSSWNIMFDLVDTEFICNLNADDKLHPSFCINAIDKFKKYPNMDVCIFTSYTSKNYNNQFGDIDLPEIYNKLQLISNSNNEDDMSIYYVKKRIIENKIQYNWKEYGKFLDVNIFNLFRFEKNNVLLCNIFGCCPIFKTKLINQFGKINEKDYGPSADAEFFLKLIYNNINVKMFNEPMSIYYINDNSYSRINIKKKNECDDKIINLYNPYKELNKIYINKNKMYDHYFMDCETRINIKKTDKSEIYYYDNEWQYPVITEKRAFELLKDECLPINYIAFPWATLIDKCDKNKDLELFKIIGNLVCKKKCFTICQHIHFRKLLPIFKNIGITHLFASHTSKYDYMYEELYGMKIIPFHLYPFNSIENYNLKHKKIKYIYSFEGAYNPKYYLKSRSYLENINNDKYYIHIKDEWNFQKEVYVDQIKNNVFKTTNDEKLDTKYLNLLESSQFTLCPSGTGPNSIRFWEALSVGSIPIVLSDHLLLNQQIEWENYIIIWEEKNFRNLKEYIEKIPYHRIQLMQNNCIELFNSMFSKTNFVKPILLYFNDFEKKTLLISNNYTAHYECIETLITKYQNIIKCKVDNIYLNLIKDDNWKFGLENKYSFIKYISNKYPNISLYKPLTYDYFIENTLQIQDETKNSGNLINYKSLNTHYYLSHRHYDWLKKYDNIILFKTMRFDYLPFKNDFTMNKNIPIYLLTGSLVRRNINHLISILNTDVNYNYNIKIICRKTDENNSIIRNIEKCKNYSKVSIIFDKSFIDYYKEFNGTFCMLYLLLDDYNDGDKYSGMIGETLNYNLYSLISKHLNKYYKLENVFEFSDSSDIINTFKESLTYFYTNIYLSK